MTCQSCGSTDLLDVIDFGSQPLCNAFTDRPDSPEKSYPLKLVTCPRCGLTQLSEVPPASEVFGPEFNYLTGSSKQNIDYFDGLAERLIERFELKPSDLVLDIASNDGTFLRAFKRRGIQVLGVEPAPKPAKIAVEMGIPTIVSRFEDATFTGTIGYATRPKMITAMNVLAHTDTPGEFLDKVYSMLGDGTFVSQSQDFSSMLEKGTYDMVYHEHARYFDASSLQNLLSAHRLHVTAMIPVDYYGDSLLVYAKVRGGMWPEEFTEMVRLNSKELVRAVMKLKAEGKKIAGIGAPAKSATLLNYCRLGPAEIEYLCESNPLKIGKFAPGSRIPVVSDEHFFANPPDVALVLSWNLADGIMKRFRERGYRGEFLVPFPTPRLVS